MATWTDPTTRAAADQAPGTTLSATSLPDLLRTLDADGEAELAALLAEQRRQADSLLQQARREAADLVAEAVASARRRAGEQAGRLRADAGSRARRTVDDAVATALDQVWAAAQQRLVELSQTDEGRRATRALLAEALRLLPGATRVHVPVGEASGLGDLTAGREVCADLPGLGAVVADDAGRSVDDTAGTRLAHAWPELRADVATGWRAR